MNEQHHEMIFDKTHTSGLEEWYCSSCGRRFLVQWPPAYKMVILEPGEKDIRHNVSKGNSPIGSLPITPTRQIDSSEGFRLLPWIQWMEKVDFDSLWGKSA